MKNKKIVFRNSVKLKDGRTLHSCGFGFHFAVQDKKGNFTSVSEKYYNKVLNSCRK